MCLQKGNDADPGKSLWPILPSIVDGASEIIFPNRGTFSRFAGMGHFFLEFTWPLPVIAIGFPSISVAKCEVKKN
jgi:hypothetical protein